MMKSHLFFLFVLCVCIYSSSGKKWKLKAKGKGTPNVQTYSAGGGGYDKGYDKGKDYKKEEPLYIPYPVQVPVNSGYKGKKEGSKTKIQVIPINMSSGKGYGGGGGYHRTSDDPSYYPQRDKEYITYRSYDDGADAAQTSYQQSSDYSSNEPYVVEHHYYNIDPSSLSYSERRALNPQNEGTLVIETEEYITDPKY